MFGRKSLRNLASMASPDSRTTPAFGLLAVLSPSSGTSDRQGVGKAFCGIVAGEAFSGQEMDRCLGS